MALTIVVRSVSSSRPSKPATALRERPSRSANAARPFTVSESSVTRRSACEGFARHDLAPLQTLQGSAQKPGIETEAANQFGRGAVFPLRDFIDDPRFLQRPRSVQQLRFDDAEPAGVDPRKAAYGGDLVGVKAMLISSNDYLTKSSNLQSCHTITIRLRNSVRDERPSCRSSLVSERRPPAAWPPSRS